MSKAQDTDEVYVEVPKVTLVKTTSLRKGVNKVTKEIAEAVVERKLGVVVANPTKAQQESAKVPPSASGPGTPGGKPDGQ